MKPRVSPFWLSLAVVGANRNLFAPVAACVTLWLK
jgi:hypothetical protein